MGMGRVIWSPERTLKLEEGQHRDQRQIWEKKETCANYGHDY
jgi:hypothetical protein